MLSKGERHQLLVEWNRTHSDYPRGKCVHELFEARAEQTPEAQAVVFGNQTMTYRELNARPISWPLTKTVQGGADVPVGICVQRSAEMVVGLLAILKAGVRTCRSTRPIRGTLSSCWRSFMLRCWLTHTVTAPLARNGPSVAWIPTGN